MHIDWNITALSADEIYKSTERRHPLDLEAQLRHATVHVPTDYGRPAWLTWSITYDPVSDDGR
jgi:hypothetical protein